MLRLGIMQYINSLPLTYALQKGEVTVNAELVSAVPTTLNRQLSSGTLDAACISATEFLLHTDKYERLGDLCIGAVDAVMSVCLYVKSTIQALDGRRIGLTGESATSKSLLRLLCKHYWKVDPIFENLTDDNQSKNWEGLLLIGDECLAHLELAGYQKIDLAAAWNDQTGLPFIFGLFAVRKEVVAKTPHAVNQIANALQLSLQWGEQHQQTIFSEAEQRSGLSRELLTRYYTLLRYRIDDSLLQGLSLFKALTLSLQPTLGAT